MGLVRLLAQSALDFLIEERCHACGSAVPATPPDVPALPPLAAPVDVVALGRFRLTSRLLCVSCASRVRRWRGRIVLPPGGTGRRFVDRLSLRPAFVTDERLLAVIHLLKFGRRERLAPWLARAMAAGLSRPAWRAGSHRPLVVPVPMDRVARARRGFNQAESIARALAAHWGLPVEPRALVKVRRTTPQSALGREERLLNLHQAFRAERPVVFDARVILVDDLVTTGATVRACALALRDAGAREVSVVCAGYRDQTRPPTSRFSNLDNDFRWD